MAIQKQKTLANGSTGNYWRLVSIYIDRQALKADARIALFKDSATSAAGMPPISDAKSFSFTFTMQEFLASANAVAFAYAKIKEQASVMVYYEINGEPVEPPRVYDEDLVGGIDVL